MLQSYLHAEVAFITLAIFSLSDFLDFDNLILSCSCYIYIYRFFYYKSIDFFNEFWLLINLFYIDLQWDYEIGDKVEDEFSDSININNNN